MLLAAALVGVRPSILLLHTLLDLSVDLHFLFFGKVLFEMVILLNFFFPSWLDWQVLNVTIEQTFAVKLSSARKTAAGMLEPKQNICAFFFFTFLRRTVLVTGPPLVSLLPSVPSLALGRGTGPPSPSSSVPKSSSMVFIVAHSLTISASPRDLSLPKLCNSIADRTFGLKERVDQTLKVGPRPLSCFFFISLLYS